MNDYENAIEIKEQIAAVFDELPFYDGFTAKTLGIMFEGMYGGWNKEQYYAYLERFHLPMKKKSASSPKV